MSLLRNSVIVGGATFLVGSAFMEIGKADSKADIGKWPYVATFLSGALGFYLLKQQFIPLPKALELNAESSSSLQSFAAEVFMADRKIRRRTRWTWTRGPEEGFTVENETPYKNLFTEEGRKGRGWRGNYVNLYSIEDAYHINDLPEGYHLHLFKPERRKDNWVAYSKSPTQDWTKYQMQNKSQLTGQLLDWYNKNIAKPATKTLSPIEKLMISKGLKSGMVQIDRVVIAATDYTPEEVQFFASGGPDELPILRFASITGATVKTNLLTHSTLQKYKVFPFAQGLELIGEKAGTLRSVNRYNKNQEQWVKSYPAWFQNAVRNKILSCQIGFVDDNGSTKTNKGYRSRMEINQIAVLKFLNGAKRYSWSEITELKKVDTQYGEQFQFQVLDSETGEFITPRPTTQAKIYDASFTKDLNGEWKLDREKFAMAVVQRYQWERKSVAIQESMQKGISGRMGLIPQSVGEFMCRRFKKNLN